MNDLTLISLFEQSELIRDKAISPTELVDAYIRKISETEDTLNSFITLTLDEARSRSIQITNQINTGNYLGPLHGIPVALKDLFDTAGIKTTSGSKIYDDRIPNADSTVASRLNSAGAILLGKLNMHPFAYGPTGENEDYGHMHNPWNPNKLTGGSSGGSGSSVSVGQCSAALGSDTGGSVRIPAALCGIVGFKPTYGKISKYGVTPLSWSLDHPGPLTRTVEDSVLMINAMSGYDSKDPSSIATNQIPLDFMTSTNISGITVGIPQEFLENIDDEMSQLVQNAISVLKDLGAEIKTVNFPMHQYSESISNCILMPEATSYHRSILRDIPEQIYEPVRLRLHAGMFISAEQYVTAQRLRRLYFEQLSSLFDEVDVLVSPTEPIFAPDILSNSVDINGKSWNTSSVLTRLNRPYNITGMPAITVPCGYSSDSLPGGLQIAGKLFDEYTVAKVAYAYQEACEWKTMHPSI
ncbi:MAG: amidase [SAR202 cluster bacterium]|nr:amidase [SAR202 cluster bacterium]MQG35357.1 amidase [SAR202 cluster bacterium]MQG86291.1 amidase [SAR202 cluster bacterium]|tara:strand:+ start:17526 stop:18929 length:1404 start_codon:yes stop_codon:yes gene_type:complete